MEASKYIRVNDTIKHNGHTLYRIQAKKDFGYFPFSVKKGDLGGYVESLDNLSQNGDCWVGYGAKVYGNAKITENGRIGNHAEVFDDAKVSGDAIITDNAKIYGRARIFGKATVCEDAEVSDGANVSGQATVCAKAHISGKSTDLGECEVRGIYPVYKTDVNWDTDGHKGRLTL